VNKLAAVVLSAIMLTTAFALVPADAGDAAPLMSVSLFDSQGHDATGNLLDNKSIPVSTRTDHQSGVTTYTIEEHTALIIDARYLVISPEDAGDCTLTVTANLEAGFIIESGLTLTFFTDAIHSNTVGKLTFGNGNPDQQMVNALLTAGQRYYITAETATDFVRTSMSPSSFYEVEFTFTATTAEGTNALHYHANDDIRTEPILSKLVTNGQVFGPSPEVTFEGHVLAGWFTQPEGGVAIHPEDTVQLTGETHLYAHWLVEGEDVIHVIDNGNEEWMWITISDDHKHVRIDGRSDTSRVFTVYDSDVIDGKVIVDTHNTAADFTVVDAKDANEQYSMVKQNLSARGFDVQSFIIVGTNGKVVCEEGSLAKLLETDCNDFRIVGDALSISLDRSVIDDLKSLTGDTVIETVLVTPEKLTPAQKSVIGDRTAYEIRVLNNGVEIESFSGTITAWFGYKAPSNMSKMQVYSASPDGKTEALPYTYGDDTVTFQTGHLSVFYLDVETEEGKEPINWWIFLLVIPLILLCLFLIAKKKNKKEDKDEAQSS